MKGINYTHTTNQRNPTGANETEKKFGIPKWTPGEQMKLKTETMKTKTKLIKFHFYDELLPAGSYQKILTYRAPVAQYTKPFSVNQEVPG